MASSATPIASPSDDDNRAPVFIACITIPTMAALILVSLRTYVRTKLVRHFGWDDITILLAMICGIVALSCNGLQVSQGFGKHVRYLTPQKVTDYLKWNIAFELSSALGCALSKISISLLLLRILGRAANRVRKYFLYGINVFVVGYTVTLIIDGLTTCDPIAKTWNPELRGTCRREESQQIIYFQGESSAAVSLCLATLPMVFFANLQLSKRNKVVICILMGLGVFDGLCSIVRCALLPMIIKTLDSAYTTIPVTIMGSLELSLAIIAACIPTLRPLFRFFDDSKTSAHHIFGQGFPKQNKNAQQGASHSNQALAGAQCILTNIELSHNDSRSKRSTQELGDPNTIRKTTEISVIV